ncbi:MULTISPECIES: ABC transporter permease [Allobacillus]|uniref:ABC transporter permease n=1 Tax=Allobacillus salarius TaxID=1955272 RepID=A0A556PP63_9BACI|nr:ABC-2 transporter permease [Allobacillus salarius]TSJ66181.1 ABC transporter permease [Allobacillus salarius]
MQWTVILKKELTENWRNFKWIWVPIVFILISIMDPISTYYMPIIIESAGGLPEGTIIDIPMPNPSEAMMMSFSQLNIIGVLILTVISMGTISGEIKSGVYELVLAKPVKYTNYVTAKFFSYWLLMIVSLFLGLLASWYYINLLFGDLAFSQLIVAALFYACWLTLLIAIVILYNTWFKSPGLIAFLSIITVIILSVMTNIFSHVLGWSPAKITEYIAIYLHTGDLDTEIWFSSLIALLVSLSCLLFAIVSLRNKAID